MYRHVSQLFLFFLLTLIPIIVPATDLPKLPMASEIRTGRLENGVTYYLVKNSTEKGKADIALVQRVGTDTEDSRSAGDGVVRARGSLSELPHFMTLTPQGFLSRNAIWPSREGYVSVSRDATVYRFSDLVLPNSPDIVDSTLLMLFDVIGRVDHPLYAPQNQAVVISGDIDADALLSKMNMLSLLVTRRSGLRSEDAYAWEESDTIRVRPLSVRRPGVATVVVRYGSARTPQENMATVQPLVSWRYARELGILVRKRLVRALRAASIPVAGLDISYHSSADGPGDEYFEIRLSTAPERYISAINLLAQTLASLDADGTMPEEYRDVQNEFNMVLRREWGAGVFSNRDYVDRCISAFLYGASLAAPKDNLDFFLTRSMDGNTAVGLFNTYVSALLDARRNLAVYADLDVLPAARVRGLFRSAWEKKPEAPAAYVVSHGDTLSLAVPKSRVKLKTTAAEPLSGGQMWTFSNGIRVIYKQVPGRDVFHYCWLLKGGYASLPGLKPGEGPYVSDMLALDNVRSMKHTAFQAMLTANGISLVPKVSLTDTRLEGAAPSSRLPLLLKSLLALAEDRQPDPAAFSYYRESESVRHRLEDRRQAILDSLLHPSAGSFKQDIALSDDFQQRAERFYSGLFGKMNDGVLILVGNFDETALKKTLTQYLGGFRTERAVAGRFRRPDHLPVGRQIRTETGERPVLDLELTAYLDYTVEHFIAANIAARVLTDAVSDALARRGWYSESSWRFDLFPADCFSLDILSSMADPAGLPASLMPVDSVDLVLQDVRGAISRTASEGISAARLKACKAELVNNYNSWSSDPETVISMLVLRYSYGKDLLTKYGEKVNAVSRDQVGRIMKLLATGPGAERIVRPVRSGEPVHVSQPQEPEWPQVTPPLPAKDSTGILDLYRELFGGEMAKTD